MAPRQRTRAQRNAPPTASPASAPAPRTRQQAASAASRGQNVSVVLDKRKGEEADQSREGITDLSGSSKAVDKKKPPRTTRTTKPADRRDVDDDDDDEDIDMDKENQTESKQNVAKGKGGDEGEGEANDTKMEDSLKQAEVETDDQTATAPTDHEATVKHQNDYNDNENNDDDDDDDDEEDDWEDAMVPQSQLPPTGGATPFEPTEHRDLEITIEKGQPLAFTDTPSGKKGPSKIEREIRIDTHCLHVQLLLGHNTIRNGWIDDRGVQEMLREQLPKAIQEEVRKWEVSAGLKPQQSSAQSSRKGKKRQKRSSHGGEDDADVSAAQGTVDPTIHLLQVLAAYWRKNFTVTAPGLRKHGYRSVMDAHDIVTAFGNPNPADDNDAMRFGERIRNRDDFCELARKMEGSRDVGAQLFTGLLRAIGLEARMVASLQPLGFAWTKAEECTGDDDEEIKGKKPAQETEGKSVVDRTGDGHKGQDAEESEEDSDSSSTPKPRKQTQRNAKVIDSDLPFPIYWTEVISPVTTNIIPVDAMIVPRAVATTPELLAQFEPRGAKAAAAKQVIAYVVAYSSDGSAKDVTTRYLKRNMYPGKTKSFRIPPENVPVAALDGTTKYLTVDWFKIIMRRYARPHHKRTAIDKREDSVELVPRQPERKAVKPHVDTLSSLRASKEFVLPRFLKREEALRPEAKPVRTFTAGKGAKASEEKVYKREDVLQCSSTESWHKEGRQIKVGETALKMVPVRAMTTTRKREVELTERETGKKATQGLYARRQTERIIPPEIVNGVIPKNAYGNIDCFAPWMVPKGATHIPRNGTKRVCKKLEIDFAEAVVGFEFGHKMAVPVISGVVVASEHAEAVRAAWQEEEAKRIERERLKQSKLILTTWRRLIMGVRIAERIREEYNDESVLEESNPFVNQRGSIAASAHATPAPSTAPRSARQSVITNEVDDDDDDDESNGGGFLMPGEGQSPANDDDDDPEGGGGGFMTAGDEAQELELDREEEVDVNMTSVEHDAAIDVENDDEELSSVQDVMSISS